MKSEQLEVDAREESATGACNSFFNLSKFFSEQIALSAAATATTIIVVVKEMELSCYKTQTVYIKQEKNIFENCHCECTNQDLNY